MSTKLNEDLNHLEYFFKMGGFCNSRDLLIGRRFGWYWLNKKYKITEKSIENAQSQIEMAEVHLSLAKDYAEKCNKNYETALEQARVSAPSAELEKSILRNSNSIEESKKIVAKAKRDVEFKKKTLDLLKRRIAEEEALQEKKSA